MIRKIAVIDDDDVYQMIIEKYIEKAAAFDEDEYFLEPKAALEYYREDIRRLPSVMLLDINMPLMDGWQFLQELESFYPTLYELCQIYIVTSSIAYSDKDKFQEFPGLSGFLSKPLSVEKLREISKALK